METTIQQTAPVTEAEGQAAVGLHRFVRCVFGATLSSGPFKGESYECGAKAIGDYYDRLYRCRRPVCRRHANVVERKAQKYNSPKVRYFKAPNAPGERPGATTHD